MARGGTISFKSVVTEGARSTVIVNPQPNQAVAVAGVAISSDAALSNTDKGPGWRLKRTGTALPTATTITAAEFAPFDPDVAIIALGLKDATVEGTLIDVCQDLFIPNVTGMVFQFAPGQEYIQRDLTAVGAISVEHVDALPSGVIAVSTMTFLE